MLIAIFLLVFITCFFVFNYFYSPVEKRIKVVHEEKITKATRDLDEMFLAVHRKKIFIYVTVAPLILGIIGYTMTHNPVITAVFALVGFSLPSIVIKNMERQRRSKFASQLIDALMLLTASLKAGLSLTQAFEELVEEMAAPLSQEFDLVIKELNMGISFDEAMSHLRKRMRSEDLDLIVTAMSIARETGGQLPAVFSKLVQTIKERQTLRGKVGALTIQSKLQGLIMSLLPVIFVVVVYKFNPEHFQLFLKDTTGRALLVYAIISQFIGILLIMKFSQVEV